MKQIHLILLMFFLFISGCAQQIPTNEQVQTKWRTTLEVQKNWRTTGKVAFISPDERQSVNFNWRLKDGKQHLILSSFIGTQVLELIEHANHSELEYQEQQYTDVSSSELVEQLSGFQIPIDQAPKWLTGTINNSSNEYDPQGRLLNTQWVDNKGKLWQISYKNYRLYSGMWLPTRLNLTHNKLRIKIQHTSWQFLNE